ncbi:MAG: ERF family protein [Pseudomonadales bacterium]
MNTSENINDLAAALSKAQSEMTGAKKSSKNPFFKSNYSDLASVCEAISEPFANNGLSYVQSPEFNEKYITVVTRIMHSSGQWIEGTIQLPPTKNDAQGYGSAITYGRRYGLQAMAGVPSVDDDGQDAVKHKAKPKAEKVDYTDLILTIRECDSIERLGEIWKGLDAPAQKALEQVKNEAKERLSA